MIGKRIKELRLKKGMSLNQLADQAGVAKSYLSYIERDLQKNPSIQFLQKVSTVLEVDIESLLGEHSALETNLEAVDDEWIQLAREAMREGINKETISEYKNFIEFVQWKNTRKQY